MQTLQKNPKTIADLNIKWTFTQINYSPCEFITEFKRSNPNLNNYKIIPNTYYFEFIQDNYYKLKDSCFQIYTITIDKLYMLMYFIHRRIATILFTNDIKCIELSRFVKIDENKFRIEEDLPF